MRGRVILSLKLTVYCLYLCAAYWISLHFPPLGMLFYPSLGSFSVILLNQKSNIKDISKIALGATTTSAIGSILYFSYPSIISFFITAFITLCFMQKFHWNAAPILAVALIPFFSHPENVWVLPVSVICSVIGLLVPLLLTHKLEGIERSAMENIERAI